MSAEAQQRREARQRAARQRTAPEAAPAGATAIRSKPVRITVDLAPELYATLTRLTNQSAMDLARKLTQSDLIRALIAATDHDPELLDAARRQLAQPPASTT